MLIRRSFLQGALALPALVLASTRPAKAATHTVRIKSMQFSPARLTIKAGDSVVFENADGPAHTATADNGSFDTGNLSSGKSASVTFSEAGEIKYFCRWHRSMRGKITVQ